MEVEARSQKLFEQLGAPTLVYRHAPSYTSWDVPPPAPWMPSHKTIDEAKYIQRNFIALSRARARWYYSVDHPFRNFNPNKTNEDGKEDDDKSETGRESKKRRGRPKSKPEWQSEDGNDNENEPDDDGDDINGESNLALQNRRRELRRILNRNPLHESRLSVSRNHLAQHIETVREQHLRATASDANWILQSRKIFDQNYIPGRIGAQKLTAWIDPYRQKKSRALAQERKNADPAYLSVPSIESIRYAMKEDFQEKANRRIPKVRTINPTKDDPHEYGNCLSCFTCRCRGCTSLSTSEGGEVSDSDHSYDADNKRTNPCSRSVCIVHPTGDLLSKVTVSNLILPRGSKNSAELSPDSLTEKKKRFSRRRPRNDLDVDEPIRQIEQCGSWDESATHNTRSKFFKRWHVGPVGHFVARTQNYCTVFGVQNLSELISSDIPGNGKAITESSSSGTAGHVTTQCSGLYNVKETVRVDLRSMYRSQPSYTPTHVTCHPNYGGNFSDLTFVVLSPSSRGELNVLHHITVRDTVLAQKHTINCLKTISDIDFTSSNPMVLWSAAKSYVRPGLKRKYSKDRPMLGHGHSLYTIDLRSNGTAVFQWSPSAEEKVPEGVHSITNIKTDWHKDHTVWVTSASAGKTWEIDGRMQCSSVNTWSLAEACSDIGAVVPRTGLNGSGILISQPTLLQHGGYSTPALPRRSPLVTVSKDPGKFGFNIHQRPEFSPRFQTKPLECASAPGVGSQSAGQVTSICTNSVFALPDVSDNTFTCGITSFRTCVSEFLSPENIVELGYERKPKDALCVVTMTNKGDLYSHSLLESSLTVPSKAKKFPDLPVGSSAVPVPQSSSSNRPGRNPLQKKYGGLNLYVELSNTAPIPSEAILPQTVATKKECRPFGTIRLEQLPTNKKLERASTVENDQKIEVQDVETIEKPHSQHKVRAQSSESSSSSDSSESSDSSQSSDTSQSSDSNQHIEQHAQEDIKAPGLKSGNGRDAEGESSDSSQHSNVEKMVSIELGACERMSVLMNSGKSDRAGNSSVARQDVTLPSRHLKAAYEGLDLLTDCFYHQEYKPSSQNTQSEANGERKIISDVDRDVFEATEKLWNKQARVEDYAVVKKEEDATDEDTY